ncbi:MAG: histidine kinase [Bacteroidales bacterium]|nr:histidine kinase [Bacteroidales bacterium]
MKAFRLPILFLVLMFCTSQTTIAFVRNTPDLMIKIPRDLQKDTAKINSLTRTGFKYLSSKEAMQKEAKACIDSALEICEKKNIEIPALLHLLFAEYHFSTSDFSSASEEASLAMKQSVGSGESSVQARTMIFFGKYYHQTGFFKESIEHFENSIALSKKKGLKGMIPRSYFGQANVYNTVGDLKNYRENLQLMIDAGFAENDSSSAERGLYLLGGSFLGDSAKSERWNFKQADSLLRKSLEISLKRKDSIGAASSYAQIGWNFYLRNMYDSSIASYNRSLDYRMIANSLGNLGTIYRDLKNPGEAVKYYQMAIDQAVKINDWYNLQWIYKDMSNMYLKLKDTTNAYINYVLFKKYSDELIRMEASRGLTSARIRYEADTHNKEVELLSLRLKNQRLLIYGFAGFIILVIAIGFLLWRGSQLKARRRISEMNHKISEITQANLRQQMNPHFIFNTLNSIQYYMYQHDKLATNNYLTKFSNLMRKVLENSQHTSIPLADELNALNLYLELECIRFKDKFDFEIKVDDDIDPLIYKVPTMLIQPYVENSICHGLMPREGKGSVKIDIKLNTDYLLCTIEDNGIGREAAQERKVMKEKNHNSLGTQITASRLDLVNALYGTSLKTLYTDLKNEAGDPAGTRVELHIPILT